MMGISLAASISSTIEKDKRIKKLEAEIIGLQRANDFFLNMNTHNNVHITIEEMNRINAELREQKRIVHHVDSTIKAEKERLIKKKKNPPL
ncbi:MAG: hypothetical protein HC836_42105 [Richelia sp. RM2_1_2]|nr:hypothetical protein [Richelia sp. RM2_1_2]